MGTLRLGNRDLLRLFHAFGHICRFHRSIDCRAFCNIDLLDGSEIYSTRADRHSSIPQAFELCDSGRGSSEVSCPCPRVVNTIFIRLATGPRLLSPFLRFWKAELALWRPFWSVLLPSIICSCSASASSTADTMTTAGVIRC